MNGDGPGMAEPCHFCYGQIISIKHILSDCIQLRQIQAMYFTNPEDGTKFNLMHLLTKSNLFKKVISYLKHIDLLHLI
jgi:hypothetical protein